jgi:hypothetical protein
LKLKKPPASDRVAPSGKWNAMVSHRVPIESANQIDAELTCWLRTAYDDN